MEPDYDKMWEDREQEVRYNCRENILDELDELTTPQLIAIEDIIANSESPIRELDLRFITINDWEFAWDMNTGEQVANSHTEVDKQTLRWIISLDEPVTVTRTSLYIFAGGHEFDIVDLRYSLEEDLTQEKWEYWKKIAKLTNNDVPLAEAAKQLENAL